MKLAKIEPHYRIPLGPLLAYYAIMAVLMTGFVQRHSSGFWQSLPVLGGAEVGSHLANLAISFLIITAIGVVWTVGGVTSWKTIGGLAAAIIAANIIYECFLSILNTRDIVDALYGIAGVLVGAAVVLLLDRSKIPTSQK